MASPSLRSPDFSAADPCASTKVDPRDYTPDMFRTEVKDIGEAYRLLITQSYDLGKVAGAVGLYKKSGNDYTKQTDKIVMVKLSNGAGGTVDTPVSRTQINKWRAIYRARLAGLASRYAKLHRKAGKARKSTGDRTTAGFRIPRFVSDRIVSFFRGANLGPAYYIDRCDPATRVNAAGQLEVVPANKAGVTKMVPHFEVAAADLKQVLPLLFQSGLTTQALMTPLFAIYAENHHLQLAGNQQSLRADGNMNQAFGTVGADGRQSTYDAVLATQQNKVLALTESSTASARGKWGQKADGTAYRMDKKGHLLEYFNANDFKYSDFQSIVGVESIPKDQYTDAQRALLAEVEASRGANGRSRLDNEWLYASHSRQRQRLQPAAVAAKAASRKAKADARKAASKAA